MNILRKKSQHRTLVLMWIPSRSGLTHGFQQFPVSQLMSSNGTTDFLVIGSTGPSQLMESIVLFRSPLLFGKAGAATSLRQPGLPMRCALVYHWGTLSGRWNDLKIFDRELIANIMQGREKGVADRGYRGRAPFLVP